MRFSLFFFVFTLHLFLSHSTTAQIEVEGVDMITREEWLAKPPKMEVTRHIPRMITIHHTGTFQNSERNIEEKLQALQKFSHSEGALGDGTPKKAWPDVPYHFYIAADGRVAEGRELEYQGDSNTNYDLDGHALIVVEGNFNKEKIDKKQLEQLKKLIVALAKKYKIPAEAVSGHKDQAETTCPGTDLYQFLPELRREVEKIHHPKIKIGAEQLLSPAFAHLVKGKRVGLVTNHTGILPDGTHLIDLLHDHPDVNLQLLFGPEHGLRGEEDTHVADGTDAKTKLPIISLYGEIRKPSPEVLKKVDVLVFDIQDIGARYYTYIKTMLLVQEAAAENSKSLIILDRPNAISAEYVDGPVGEALDPNTGVGVLPVTHGMTVGEIALMYNGEREEKSLEKAKLTVIPLQNYKRNQWYDETGLPWIKPSPNILNLQTAVVYPATCLLEGTNYSEARGTKYPFERFGAPWVKGRELADRLNNYKMEGVQYRPVIFLPDSIVDGIKIYPPKFLGEQVNGVEMLVTDRDKFKSVEAGIYILHALKMLYPENFEWRQSRIDGLLGTSEVREMIDVGNSPEAIFAKWKEGLESFGEKRAKFLLY